MADQPTIKIRSTIKRELKTFTVKKGSLIGGSGAILLLVGTLSLPKMWMPWIFLASLLLISIGLSPYRKLSHLELHPHLLTLEGDQLHFFKSGRRLFQLPISTIERLEYVENKHLYGIALYRKEPGEQDLFFPYFTEKSLGMFKDQLE
ncbi:MAG: hypothetical protein S4CHLAM45_03810 [Chlamydiales bacterium]|nr:hypothetical protein [Chlamydiales bacterium]MCH9619235.1 hypothetical protein [Chlamydiales bacterium]MCH9622497.1 hypothetical protein [Chlamydiales bacterium]